MEKVEPTPSGNTGAPSALGNPANPASAFALPKYFATFWNCHVPVGIMPALPVASMSATCSPLLSEK